MMSTLQTTDDVASDATAAPAESDPDLAALGQAGAVRSSDGRFKADPNKVSSKPSKPRKRRKRPLDPEDRRLKANRGKPPRDDASPKGSRKRVKPSATIQANVTNGVASLGGLLTMYGAATESPHYVYDGTVIAGRAEEIGEVLADMAAVNPAIKRALEALFAANSWGKALMTVGGVLVPILACHGVIPQAPMVLAPFLNAEKGIDMPPAPPDKRRKPSPVPTPETSTTEIYRDVIVDDDGWRHGTPIVLNDERAAEANGIDVDG